MPAALMILLQASTSVPAASRVDDFDLRQIRQDYDFGLATSGRCAADDDPTVIVVCASRNDERYRLRPPSGDFTVAGPPMAEADLGGGVTGAIELDSAGMPNGEVSKRIMIRVGTKF